MIFLNIIDLSRLFIIPQSETTAAQGATNGQAKKNSQSCRRSALKVFAAFDRELAAYCDVTQLLSEVSEPKEQRSHGAQGGVSLAFFFAASQQKMRRYLSGPVKKCKSYCTEQQREGIWTDEQIQAPGENGHQVGNDLPPPYGVITCRFAANWQRTPAYGISSPQPACEGSAAFTVSSYFLSLFNPSFCSLCLPLHILPLRAALTSFSF